MITEQTNTCYIEIDYILVSSAFSILGENTENESRGRRRKQSKRRNLREDGGVTMIIKVSSAEKNIMSTVIFKSP